MNDNSKRRLEIWAAIATILALIVAFVAYVWPRSPGEIQLAETLVALDDRQVELSRQLTDVVSKQSQAAIPANLEATLTAVQIQKNAVEATIAASTPRFSPINLSSIANWPFDHLLSPPTGQISLAGIPFTILAGNESVFQTQHHLLRNLPTQGGLKVSIARPIFVHILLNGAYVNREFQNRKVGEINLTFSNGSDYTVPLIAWQNIRETWAYEADTTVDLMNTTQETTWQNVWSEKQDRGSEPARAFIDMLTISVPTSYADSVLVSITIRDTSVDTVGSFDPSLVVMAITVESGQR